MGNHGVFFYSRLVIFEMAILNSKSNMFKNDGCFQNSFEFLARNFKKN